MMWMLLLSTGLAAAPAGDPFAVEKVTLTGPPVAVARPNLQPRRRPAPFVLPPSQHDDATETSGPVIRTGKGVLHCKGHWFPAVAEKKK